MLCQSAKIESKKNLQPLLKWAGGKESELKHILPNLPKVFDNYYEPFVGGGAVYTAINAKRYFINDKSRELISFYKCIVNGDREQFFKVLDEIACSWGLQGAFIHNHVSLFMDIYNEYTYKQTTDEYLQRAVHLFTVGYAKDFYHMLPATLALHMSNFLIEIKANLVRKIKRMQRFEAAKAPLLDKDVLGNIETALRSAFYMQMRYIYNRKKYFNLTTASEAAIFFFIRNFAYGGMFRYNASGHFNVPYGGRAYNNKQFKKKVDYLRSLELQSHLRRTTIRNLDFEEFLHLHTPSNKDFIFCDPPYDTQFSTYTKNEFKQKDQIRLASYLIKHCKAQWMMVIKNTHFIHQLYVHKGLRIKSFGKTYLVSFMNRNDKKAEHLLITNY